MSAPELDLPHDLEAEQAVLGAAILDTGSLVESLSLLQSDYFFHQPHRTIFEAMAAMHAKGIPVDEITLPSWLKDSGDLPGIGGHAYLSSLIDVTPDTTNVEYYARIIDDKRRLRQLKTLAAKIREYNGPFEQILDDAMTDLYQIAEKGHREELRPISHAVDESVLDSIMISTGHQEDIGVPTYFPRLDEKLTISPGKLIVVAGTTGAGKTSLALQMIDNMAMAGRKVALFSLEMTEREIADRLLARRLMIASDALTRGRVGQSDHQKLEKERRVMAETFFYVCDDSDVSPMDIRTRARKLQLQKGLDIVVVDYIQLVSPPKALARRSRENEISFIVQELKKMAKALGVGVIALSQITDNPEQQKRAPDLRDLRESRAIGHHSDAVLMLYRPDQGCPATELYIRKNRNGPLAKIEYAFQGAWVKFRELQERGNGNGPMEY